MNEKEQGALEFWTKRSRIVKKDAQMLKRKLKKKGKRRNGASTNTSPTPTNDRDAYKADLPSGFVSNADVKNDHGGDTDIP